MSEDATHVRVGIRVRPHDRSRGSGEGIDVDTEKKTIAHGKSSFRFSAVYREESNEELFNVVGLPLLSSTLMGYNGTLMAYGQTGSGKTYTIGEIKRLATEHEGIAHRMVRRLYSHIFADPNHE